MGTRKVKGTMLLDLVRMIRKNKDEIWDQYLEPEDWEIINSKILDSTWYPLGIYERCGLAIFEILAGGDPGISRARGKMRGKELFEGVYQGVIIKNNPMKTLHKFVSMYDLLFNFSTLTPEEVGEKHAKIHHSFDRKNPDKNIPYCLHLKGILDALAEVAGAKDAKIELTDKQWENAPATVFDITWR